MAVSLGGHELEFGGEYLGEMRESTDIADDPAALRRRLAEDGYVLVRGLHDEATVNDARREFTERLAEDGLLAPAAPTDEAVMADPEHSTALSGGGCEHRQEFPDIHAFTESDELFDFFRQFLGTRPFTYDYKWIRATGRAHTDFHYDRIFMGRGTEQLYTVWSPLGDVPVEMGPLVVCEGSQEFETLKDTYGQVDVDLDAPPQETHLTDPFDVVDTYGGRWVTAAFEAGDALIFGPYTLHGALTNTTDRYRLSTDIRFQSIEEPTDPRWVGVDPVSSYGP
jgi:ectoine hydroxylase-related dioxygenase (phytanoyl-CoA dioxygenase family)